MMLSEAERMMMARALLAPPPAPPPPPEPQSFSDQVSGWAANNLPAWAQPGQMRNQQVLPDQWGDVLPYPIQRLRKK